MKSWSIEAKLTLIFGLLGLGVAILAWIFPFGEVGPSLGRPTDASASPSSAGRPTDSPGATTTEPATPNYRTLALQAYSHREKLEDTDTLLGLMPGLNHLTDSRIPFELGWTASTNCSTLPNDPEALQVDTDISHATHLYILLQAGNSNKEYAGREIGGIRAVFSDGSSIATRLILGVNIRDWAAANPAVVNTLSGEETEVAWEGVSRGTQGVIDLLTMEIPNSHRTLRLTGIEVEDTSLDTVGTSDPCIHIPAITVRYLE